MSKSHRSLFAIGDKVIDCAPYHGRQLTHRKGTVVSVTFTAKNVIYQVMATGGSKFTALENALVHELAYDKYVTSLHVPEKTKIDSRLSIHRKLQSNKE